MNQEKLNLKAQAKIDRYLGQKDLYYLAKTVLGYGDMVPHVHGEMADFFTNPSFGRYRQACVPRSWFKTWLMTIAFSIWLTLPDEEGIFADVFPFKGCDARILIASNISDNAEKMISKIREEWEKNTRLQAAFPEIVPEFNKVRWSNSCADVKRQIRATEGTYTSVGAGGGVISQHFDMIIEDDLIYAKKDDFSGQELMPNQEDIDKAIGWHKLATSLLVDPKKSCIFNVGTRWAPHDLIDYIRENEHQYNCFEITVTEKDLRGNAIWPIDSNDMCIWPERYDIEALNDIRASQGAKIFETQYLCRPRAGEDVTFDVSYLNLHDSISDYPRNLQWRTYVDLASWGDKKRIARNVILTMAKAANNHLFLGRVDAGRYTPSEVIDLIKVHQKQFNSRVLVEEIQYQRALRHFALQQMERDGHVYDIEQIPYDGRKNAKELRIEALEPHVKNGFVHILRTMKDFKTEMEDYPYGATRDILDCAGYGLRLCPVSEDEERKETIFPFTREALEKELKDAARTDARYPFKEVLSNVQEMLEPGEVVEDHTWL